MDIVLATRNRKKLAELQRILAGLDVSLHTLDEFPDCPDVEEDSETFAGNARKKASAIASCTRMIALSDDSGLVVDALGGAPGVLSARYAGVHGDDHANVVKLLSDLEGVPSSRRQGRFLCVIALAHPDGKIHTFEGVVEGTIGLGSQGSSGFGYDPVFSPEGYDRTFAQMRPEEKDSMSHRSRALAKLRAHLGMARNIR